MRLVPVGAVVVNWNGRGDTLACLESLLTADPRPARVVVVDNGSTDDSVPAISAWIARRADSGFEMLRSNENRGFAGASNLALRRLASDANLAHFFLLNNDAAVDAGCFGEIEHALAEAPATAILGPTIFETGSARVWYAGGVVSRWRAFGRSYHEIPRGGARVVPTEFVSGCAMVISRRAWDLLGPLPESYFMYFEDAEYCMRARAAGLEIGYAPRGVVHHRVAGTVDRGAVAAGLASTVLPGRGPCSRGATCAARSGGVRSPTSSWSASPRPRSGRSAAAPPAPGRHIAVPGPGYWR